MEFKQKIMKETTLTIKPKFNMGDTVSLKDGDNIYIGKIEGMKISKGLVYYYSMLSEWDYWQEEDLTLVK